MLKEAIIIVLVVIILYCVSRWYYDGYHHDYPDDYPSKEGMSSGFTLSSTEFTDLQNLLRTVRTLKIDKNKFNAVKEQYDIITNCCVEYLVEGATKDGATRYALPVPGTDGGYSMFVANDGSRKVAFKKYKGHAMIPSSETAYAYPGFQRKYQNIALDFLYSISLLLIYSAGKTGTLQVAFDGNSYLFLQDMRFLEGRTHSLFMYYLLEYKMLIVMLGTSANNYSNYVIYLFDERTFLLSPMYIQGNPNLTNNIAVSYNVGGAGNDVSFIEVDNSLDVVPRSVRMKLSSSNAEDALIDYMKNGAGKKVESSEAEYCKLSGECSMGSVCYISGEANPLDLLRTGLNPDNYDSRFGGKLKGRFCTAPV